MTDRHKLLRECREELQESIDNEGKLASFAALIKRIDAALAEPQEQNVVVTAEMVDRFLSWPLPESVCADLCTTESSFYQKRGHTHDGRCGTNLLSAGEARQMLEHVLNVAPQVPQVGRVDINQGMSGSPTDNPVSAAPGAMPEKPTSLRAEARLQKVKGNDLLTSLLELHADYEDTLVARCEALAGENANLMLDVGRLMDTCTTEMNRAEQAEADLATKEQNATGRGSTAELVDALELIATQCEDHPLYMPDASDDDMMREGGDSASITYWAQTARSALHRKRGRKCTKWSKEKERVVRAAMRWYEGRMAKRGDEGFEGYFLSVERTKRTIELKKACAAASKRRKP